MAEAISSHPKISEMENEKNDMKRGELTTARKLYKALQRVEHKPANTISDNVGP
jgi:hypothetical protein